MTTKTISLSSESYNLLKSIKRKDESFSDVIKRLLGRKGRLTEVLDLYPELKGERELETAIRRTRKEFDKRLEKVMDEMH